MGTILNYDEEKSSILTGDCIEAIVRRAARKMLAVALEAEVNEFIQSHKGIRDSEGHQAVSFQFSRPTCTTGATGRERKRPALTK